MSDSERIAELEHIADQLAVTVFMLLHDAHPVWGNTSGPGGGIGGQALTATCSIIRPYGVKDDWAAYDLPSMQAREWLRQRDINIEEFKSKLKQEWISQII